MKRIKYLLFLLICIFICNYTFSVDAADISYPQFNLTNVRLQTGQSTTDVKVMFPESDINYYVVRYKTTNSKVVIVDENGKLTALKPGAVIITAEVYNYGPITTRIRVQNASIKTTALTLPQKSVTLKKGEKFTLSPQLDPITSQDAVTYTSSDKKVATVSKKGVITAKKAGTAKITVKAGNKKATFTVKVAKTRAEQITNVPASKKLKKGKSFTLKPKTVPAKTDDTITYKSSNKKVATVSSKGKVVAKKKGKATITVKCGKVSVKCKITVK